MKPLGAARPYFACQYGPQESLNVNAEQHLRKLQVNFYRFGTQYVIFPISCFTIDIEEDREKVFNCAFAV